MPMKDPPHPGLLIKANFEELGISIVDAANRLHMDPHQLEAITNGEAPITADVAIRLGLAFKHDNREFWLRLQAAYDLAQAEQSTGNLDIQRFAVT